MPLDVGALLFELAKKIVFDAISKRVNYAGESFLTKRRIKSRLDDSIAQVVEQLVPFLDNEHISENQRGIIIATCEEELSPLLKKPQEFFAASLDGQKVFDRLYAKGELPRSIREEGLQDLYGLIFPQIANLICAYPVAVEQWKIEGFRDGFRRLDEIADTLGNVAVKIDKIVSQTVDTADLLLSRVRQALVQRVEFQLDLTGLRGERPDAVPLEKCFIVPELVQVLKDMKTGENPGIHIGSEEEMVRTFAASSLRTFVLGSPGSGKSTWSRWLQRTVLTTGAASLAILVRLRELTKLNQLPSHQELVREAAGIHLREEIHADSIREWCELGKITFILDGFDEVPSNHRDAILSWIKELDTAVGRAGLIVTSRPLTSDHLNRLKLTDQSWELLPFDEPRVIDYIGRWYANAPVLTGKPRDVDAGVLAASWLRDPVLRPLVGNPLMLTTLLMVHHMDGRLPGGRSRLYQRYIDGMTGLWNSRWGIPAAIDLSSDLKKKILTKLALKLHCEQVEHLDDSEMRTFLDKVLPDLACGHLSSIVLDHLRERTGLLVGPGIWSFIHKSVSEFLVAVAIEDGDEVDGGQKLDRLRLFKERHDDRWNTVLFFWAGLTTPGNLQSFIEQVAAEESDEDSMLALGLMVDQLQPHRLSEPWRSTQLLNLLKRGFGESIVDSTYVWGAVPKSWSASYPYYSRAIRGIEPILFIVALSRCLRSSTLTCEQLPLCHKSVRSLFWLHFLEFPRSTGELRAALLSHNGDPCLGEPSLAYPMTVGLAAAADKFRDVNLQDYLMTLRESIPETRAFMVFFLIGQCVFHDLLKNRLNIEGWPTNDFRGFLPAIDAERDAPVDPAMLVQTRGFIVFDSKEPVDLLAEFLMALNRAVERGWVSEDAVTGRVRENVKELIKMRDAGGLTT
jgi:hypothetical protein